MSTQVVAYLRVSGRGQVEGDGFDRQIAAIRNYASSNGLEVVRVFQEEGVSGATSWENRTAWVEMLQFCLDSGIRTVAIERLDRLARDLMVQEHVLADIRTRGMEILSVYEPDLCTDDPTRKLMRQIMGAVAEYDRAMVVLKLRGARQRVKTRTGRCEGRKPYGHSEQEAHDLQILLDLKRRGYSLAAIRETLESTGVPAPNGPKWHINTLSRILRRSL